MDEITILRQRLVELLAKKLRRDTRVQLLELKASANQASRLQRRNVAPMVRRTFRIVKPD